MLTRRENYTRILTRGNGDRLPFVPNFDYWYRVNRANGRIPEAYAGLSRNDLVRAVGATLWVRTNVLEPVLDPTVEVTERDDGRRRRTEYRTPVGTVSTLHEYADDSARTCYLMEHRIKRAEDIPVVKYLFEHTSLKADFTSFLESEAEVGEDGISLVGLPFCFPYIHFAKQEAGYQAGIYLYADYPELVEELMEVIARVNLAGAELLASGPALVVQQGDNMDEWTTPPNLFKRLAVPYFRRVAEILHRAGKIYQGHWCGRTEHLLPLVPGSGLDVIEAVS
ncbi:MAG TPA: uroporphyrinogen decarboxylase family protein, partial [bacterium]|nr:uroporphyrinogen decarboxylase family protein [bacterium]